METDNTVENGQINELADALSKAQAEMESARKDANNPFFRSKYADLASIVAAIKEPLSKHGLAYSQLVNFSAGFHYVDTILMHKSGQLIKSSMLVKPSKDDMQALGSAITYARRYALQAIVGLSADDDDGESAVGRNGNGKEKVRVKMPEVLKPNQDTPRNAVNAPTTNNQPDSVVGQGVISKAEAEELITLAKASGYNKKELYEIIFTYGYTKVVDVTAQDFGSIKEELTVSADEYRKNMEEFAKENWGE